MGGFSQDLIWVSYRMIYSNFFLKIMVVIRFVFQFDANCSSKIRLWHSTKKKFGSMSLTVIQKVHLVHDDKGHFHPLLRSDRWITCLLYLSSSFPMEHKASTICPHLPLSFITYWAWPIEKPISSSSDVIVLLLPMD